MSGDKFLNGFQLHYQLIFNKNIRDKFTHHNAAIMDFQLFF